MKELHIFDLDMTLIDSSHRTQWINESEVDLNHWRKHETREHIFKDTLLPMVNLFHFHRKSKNAIVGFCTMRGMLDCEYEFLELHSLHYDFLIHRKGEDTCIAEYKEREIKALMSKHNIPEWRTTFYEDNPLAIERMRNIGITVVDANVWNKEFGNG